MSALSYAGHATLYSESQETAMDEPDCPKPSSEYLAALNARGDIDGSHDVWASSMDAALATHPVHQKTSLPGVKWAEEFSYSYGKCTHICAGAWCVFITIPLLFFMFALPPLQERVELDVTTFGIVVWLLCAICFVATAVTNPGVPPEPKPPGGRGLGYNNLPHPGAEYTMSRDTQRYVRGFDHFCEFVGNDIGRGNLGCFVAFLVLLSTLATYVVVASAWGTILEWLPQHLVIDVHGSNATADAYLEPAYHMLNSPWRMGTALAFVALVLYALFKCYKSDACAGIGPLIMLMPGSRVGALLIMLVILATVLLPFTSNMFEGVTPETNPAAFFLILPALCFAVLFWGMSVHWVWLLAEGVSQKLWLKQQVLFFPQKLTYLRQKLLLQLQKLLPLGQKL